MGEKKSNPWHSLSTVTTFDRGTHARSTARLENASKQIVGIVTASTSLLIESLVQQLCTLFEGDPITRNKLYLAICDRLHELKLIDGSYAALELDSIRSQYQLALHRLFSVARAAAGCDGALTVARPLAATEFSRYRREFEELSFIASGGFGNVFKALHRLDGIEYAVKKIIVRCNAVASIAQHLEEVKTLAKLNHTNIVAYKCAWMEPATFSAAPPLSTFISIDTFSDSNEFNNAANNSSDNDNENENENEESRSNSISFRSEEEKSGENFGDGIVLPYSSNTSERYATLYIQMALCEQTLQQWMDERIEMSSHSMILGIVTQILCGLDYIHSRGIVHHDIKPSNIFISTTSRLQIQLGDFGLACPLQREMHRSILGTHMYAAPEQLQGKCDPKSDVYSLGIVLLELLVRTRTQMERIEIINGLKRGQIPVTLTATYPKWAHIVSELVEEDPRKRPSTSELLQELNEDKDTTIAMLKDTLAERDDLIRQLEEKISMLQQQVAVPKE